MNSYNNIDILRGIVNNDISKIPSKYKEKTYIDSDKSIWKTFCIGIITCDNTQSN
jgi:hypothetical protein